MRSENVRYLLPEEFRNNLVAVVDANYNFIYIDVGTNGRANDACVFENQH